MPKKKQSGGATAQGGFEYQDKLAAWFAVQILAEKNVQPLWELPSDRVLEQLYCESDEPIDDLKLVTSQQDLIYIQAKHSINLETTSTSELASVANQFVEQYFSILQSAQLTPFNKSRFILATSSCSPGTVRLNLKKALDKVRGLTGSETVQNLYSKISKDQEAALKTFCSHLNQSWKDKKGTLPSQNELTKILQLSWVQIFNLDTSEHNEIEALNLLRQVVLQEPDQADDAWKQLLALCKQRSILRGGLDQHALQEEFLRSGKLLQTVRSFQRDIEKLRSISQRAYNELKEKSCIFLDETHENNLNIQRSSSAALIDAATTYPYLLVVGDPGAGKSGAIFDLVTKLKHTAQPYLLFLADQFEAASLPSLQQEIGLEHPIEAILENWPTSPKFLIIDAMDAARTAESQATFRLLIKNKNLLETHHWKVIVSIRKFDLRYSDALRQIFRGTPPERVFVDSEFSKVSHINIPRLTNFELDSLARQHSKIHQFIQALQTDSKLYELCKNLFNFKLIAQLLENDVEIDKLALFESRLELLDLYWNQVVIGNFSDSRARESVLAQLTNTMVSEQRMRVLDESSPISSGPLVYLLQRNVLSESVQRSIKHLSFSHHIIFDYAIFRLFLMRLKDEDLINALSEPAKLLFIRPSLLMFFQDLWRQDKENFWGISFQLQASSQASGIAKTIPAMTISESPYCLVDYHPLIFKLASPIETEMSIADEMLKHLIGALLVAKKNNDSFDILSWSQFIEVASRHERKEVFVHASQLLRLICQQAKNLPSSEPALQNAGISARRLLAWAWRQPEVNLFFSTEGIRNVCWTFHSNSTESDTLLRQAIRMPHIQQYGSKELFWIANGLKNFYEISPEFAKDLYIKVFEYTETSTEVSSIGPPSQILGLHSTVKQDYEGVRYSLAKDFNSFLEKCPLEATEALIHIVSYYAQTEHHTKDEPIRDFYFKGTTAKIAYDHSYIWDYGDTYDRDSAKKILISFENYILSLSTSGNIELLYKLLLFLTHNNVQAVLWKRLIEWGAKSPVAIGLFIKELTWTPELFIAPDTSYALGQLILILHPTLEREDRQKIEQTILSIPLYGAGILHEPERARNKFITCLIPENIQSEEIKELLNDPSQKFIPNTPLFSSSRFQPIDEDDEDYEFFFGTSRSKKSPEDQETVRLKQFNKDLQSMMSAYQSGSITHATLSIELPIKLGELFTFLKNFNHDTNTEGSLEQAWSNLTEGCFTLLANEDVSQLLQPNDLELIKKILLLSQGLPREEDWERVNKQFDESSLYSSTPLVSTTRAITFLVRHKLYMQDKDLLDAIQVFAQDPDPSIRYQLLSYLINIYRDHQNLFWEILEGFFQHETCIKVFYGLNPWIINLAKLHPNRIESMTEVLFNHIQPETSESSEKVRETCLFIHLWLYIFNNKRMSQFLGDSIQLLPQYSEEFRGLIFSLRKQLTNQEAGIQSKLKLFFKEVLSRLLASWQESLVQSDDSSTGLQIRTNIIGVADQIAAQFYFASENLVKSSKNSNLSENEPDINLPLQSLLEHIGEFLVELTTFRHPSIIHHLIELLENCIHVDPALVFHHLSYILGKSEGGGYEYEWQAKDTIIKILNKLFADHRYVLQDSANQASLIQILDLFVNAGWLEARELTYQLEEVLR